MPWLPQQTEFSPVNDKESAAHKKYLLLGQLAGVAKGNEIIAEHDPKTGLLQYPKFKKQAQERINAGPVPNDRKHPRRPDMFSLIIADLDDFKSLNKLLGYEETDAMALIPTAKIIGKYSKRLGDVIGINEQGEHGNAARFGGEEFVLLLEGTDQIGATVVAGRIRSEVNQLSFAAHDGVTRLGVSMGIVSFPTGSSYDQAFKVANKALDQAKDIQGKNQVVMLPFSAELPV